MDFAKAEKLRKSMIPKEGFNLVGVDDFEMPEEALYLIKHSKDHDELMVLKKKKEAEGVKCHIYTPDME